MQSQFGTTIYKERGETLAVLLERFRREHRLSDDTKLTYAGRLDPMAEGLVLVLAGEDRFHKDALLGLPKTYVVEVLLGIATDTLDPLGLITEIGPKEITESDVRKVIEQLHTITELPYPQYSSVPVEGKALFVHARAGHAVTIPMKKIHIHDVHIFDIRKESIDEIASLIMMDIAKVVGDFRQTESIDGWKKVQNNYADEVVTIATIEVSASSGTYMRSIAEWIGQQLDVPALAYSIKRIKLGDYEL